MNPSRLLPFLTFSASLIISSIGCAPQPTREASAPVSSFMLRSPGLAEGATVPDTQVYDGNGCGGGNVSPELQWAGAPANTRSFAVTVFDPDAGGGKGWWHWAAYNIPVQTTLLAAGAGNLTGGDLPRGAVQAQNDFRAMGYGGPCPPKGNTPHHYVFTVYALDVSPLDVPGEKRAADVDAAARSHNLGKATLTVRYGR